MRRSRPLLLAAIAAIGFLPACGGRLKMPSEAPAQAIPQDKSYQMLDTWRNMDGIRDVLMTPAPGTQLFLLFNHGGTGGPQTPRGELRLYSFTQPTPIGGIFDSLLTLFNPVAVTSGQNELFVLDEGDSCMAKYDPVRGTCEAEAVLHGRPSIIWDYSATWRVREYPLTGGDTISTFTDTTFAYVNGIAADNSGHVYVSGIVVVLDTLATDQRIRTRKFISRIYRYARGGPSDINMPGANWHRDMTWTVLDGTGASSVSDPRGMMWSPLEGGSLLVADRGNNKVKLIATYAEGVGLARFDGSDSPGGTNLNGPQGVAIDGAGYLYAVDRYNQRVLRYDLNGNFVQIVNVEKNSDVPPEPLLDPVAVGADNMRCYVADPGRNQVIRYQRRP